MDVTVFYAWQSDRPEKVNHYLIRDAAIEACARITVDPSNDWSLKLDSDTKDTPGMCDIPNTILAKIRKADIFLADLTLVGKTETNPPKLLPNSNVVFELGYAAKKLTFKALIGVVNEAFGKLESQVFDIKRRRGLAYSAAPDLAKAELKKATEKLSKDLEKIIRGTIEAVVVPMRRRQGATELAMVEEKRGELASRLLEGRFHDLRGKATVLTSFFFAPQDIDYETLGGPVRKMFGTNPVVDADSYSWHMPSVKFEFSRTGYFHRACTRDYESFLAHRRFLGDSPEPNRYFLAVPLVGNIVRGVLDASAFLTALKIKTPWRLAISIVGAKGFMLLDQREMAAERPLHDDILHLPMQRVTAIAQVADPLKVGTLLKAALDHLMRYVGWEFNWCYTENGLLNVRV